MTHATKKKVAPRKAVAVDASPKRKNLQRLARIEGQVRGIRAMVEEERYCADILVQLSAVQEALRGVGLALLDNHLRHCASHAIRGNEDERQAMIAELVDLTKRFAR